MRLLKICTVQNYESNGENRHLWRKIGELCNSDSGQMYIHLYQQPDTRFYVFDYDEKPRMEIEVSAEVKEE